MFSVNFRLFVQALLCLGGVLLAPASVFAEARSSSPTAQMMCECNELDSVMVREEDNASTPEDESLCYSQSDCRQDPNCTQQDRGESNAWELCTFTMLNGEKVIRYFEKGQEEVPPPDFDQVKSIVCINSGPVNGIFVHTLYCPLNEGGSAPFGSLDEWRRYLGSGGGSGASGVGADQEPDSPVIDEPVKDEPVTDPDPFKAPEKPIDPSEA